MPSIIIKIQTNDGQTFSVDSEIVKCSGTIKDMLQLTTTITTTEEDDDDGGDGASEEVSSRGGGETEEELVYLEKLDGRTWQKIDEWATYHKDDPRPKKDVAHHQQRSVERARWDAEFVNYLDQAELFNLLTAANFRDIKPLLDLLCTGVANLVKGKTPQDIRQMFGFRNTFTPAAAE